MSFTGMLPRNLYHAAQVRELDRTAIETFSVPGLTLMERAGAAAYDLLCKSWPEAEVITVVCGIGNNGGDGYVLARLALQAGKTVRLLQLGDVQKIKGDARTNYERFAEAGGEIQPFKMLTEGSDVIIDGIFGTGLEREVAGEWRQAIEAINHSASSVLALDIPSGLHSDSGQVLGAAVKADATISFIGLKRGQFTGAGPEQCGQILFDDLDVPEAVYQAEQPTAKRIEWPLLKTLLGRRARDAHKGDFGHVLVIGGDHGFSGAARMAGEAALRTGAGLVSIATRPEHAALLNVVRPELMCHGVADAKALVPLLQRATVIAVGPGLGQTSWGQALLNAALETKLPLIADADALNQLAVDPTQRDNWILTPHPGEAARLLGVTSADIQSNRFQSAQALQEKYGGVVVLKGAGTLVTAGAAEPIMVCSAGNPGMATGCMGDLLTGIIAGMVAQGLSLSDAAAAGVCLHAAAADRAAQAGERGLLANDLQIELRLLLNTDWHQC